MEWRSVVFSNENRFYLGASDAHVLLRRKPVERLEPTRLWPKPLDTHLESAMRLLARFLNQAEQRLLSGYMKSKMTA
ncbi:hypothetical protein TNCV_2237531 [Trichonephila clavipes]|nr:hypothetical protein TNCV_2237531 [Trichonephila clavipes]